MPGPGAAPLQCGIAAAFELREGKRELGAAAPGPSTWRQRHRHGRAIVAARLVAGPHGHPIDPGRDANAGDIPGEGLLVVMRVQERARSKEPTVGRHRLESIRVVVPRGVMAAYGDVEIVYPGRAAAP